MSNLGGLSPGKLVATANGKCTAHALASLQDRGKLFISSGQVRACGVFVSCFTSLFPDGVCAPPLPPLAHFKTTPALWPLVLICRSCVALCACLRLCPVRATNENAVAMCLVSQEVYNGMVIGEHARAGDLEVRALPSLGGHRRLRNAPYPLGGLVLHPSSSTERQDYRWILRPSCTVIRITVVVVGAVSALSVLGGTGRELGMSVQRRTERVLLLLLFGSELASISTVDGT